MAGLYFEDFAVGQVFSSARSVRVEKDEIIAFAKKYDPQFFHLDEEAARIRFLAAWWRAAGSPPR